MVTVVAGRRFDWRLHHDPRSEDFPIRPLLQGGPRSRTWPCYAKLNQAREGACVGHGWAHEAAAVPDVREVTQQDAFDLYFRARQLDEWPGHNYEGTSVLAGAKAAQERGWLDQYRWCFGIDDVVATLQTVGPVVLGVPWRVGMLQPDRQGLIHAAGGEVGGHCLLARGIRLSGRPYRGAAVGEPLIVLRNSWGEDWGENGDCLITRSDLRSLLRRGGEACVPIRS
jgi:hypothetical protein